MLLLCCVELELGQQFNPGAPTLIGTFIAANEGVAPEHETLAQGLLHTQPQRRLTTDHVIHPIAATDFDNVLTTSIGRKYLVADR